MGVGSPMDQTEDRKDVVADAIALSKQASELREVAITKLLEQREKIERDLKTLGFNGYAQHGSDAKPTAIVKPTTRSRRNFKGLSLAEVGRALLQHGQALHGKEIERLAKESGFKGGTKNFQNYLPVAFKRAGGFENIGGNRWRLNEKIAPMMKG